MLVATLVSALALSGCVTRRSNASRVKDEKAAEASTRQAMSQCKDLVLGVDEWDGLISELVLVQVDGGGAGGSFQGAGGSVEGVAVGVDGAFAMRLVCDEGGLAMTDRSDDPEEVVKTKASIEKLLKDFPAELRKTRVAAKNRKKGDKEASLTLTTIVVLQARRAALAEHFDEVLKTVVGTITSSAPEYSSSMP